LTCIDGRLFGKNVLGTKIKGPELGCLGAALRGVGDGRGLIARDAVCIDSIVSV
jgi:hypothetical protein